MGKEEENLFGDINLDTLKGKEVDSSIFEQEPEIQDKDTKKETSKTESPDDSKKDKNKKETPNEEDTPEGVDSSFFENNNTDTKSSVDEPSDNSSSLLRSFVSTLKEEGLINIEDDQIESVKDAKDLIKNYRETLMNNEFNDLTDNQRLYVESLRNGIPEEVIKTNFNNIKALNGLNPDVISNDESEDLRKTLIAQDFIAKGISENKAAKLAQRSIESGEDVDDALEAYNSLKEIEENKLKLENNRIKEQEKLAAKKNEEILSKLKDEVLNKETFGPDIKVNATTKQKIFDNMTKVIDYDKKGKGITALQKAAIEKPEEFTMIQSFIYTITNGFKDWNKFKNVPKSKAIQELDKALQQSNSKGGTPRQIQSSTSKGLMQALSKFD